MIDQHTNIATALLDQIKVNIQGTSFQFVKMKRITMGWYLSDSEELGDDRRAVSTSSVEEVLSYCLTASSS